MVPLGKQWVARIQTSWQIENRQFNQLNSPKQSCLLPKKTLWTSGNETVLVLLMSPGVVAAIVEIVSLKERRKQTLRRDSWSKWRVDWHTSVEIATARNYAWVEDQHHCQATGEKLKQHSWELRSSCKGTWIEGGLLFCPKSRAVEVRWYINELHLGLELTFFKGGSGPRADISLHSCQELS